MSVVLGWLALVAIAAVVADWMNFTIEHDRWRDWRPFIWMRDQ